MNFLLDKQKTKTYLDSTMMSCWRQCPRKYFFKHALNLRSEEPAIALEFGVTVHNLLEAYFKDEEPKPFVEYATEGYLELLNNEFVKVGGKTLENTEKTFHKYIDHWKDLENYDVLEVEDTLTSPLPGDNIKNFICKIDVILKHKETGKIVVMDHKTSSASWLGQWPYQWTFDHQMYNYLKSVKEKYKTTNLSVIVDGIFFPSGKKSFFHRVEIPFTFNIEDEATHNQLDTLHQIELNTDLMREQRSKRTLTAFPKNSKSCTAFGRKCEFYTMCEKYPNPTRVPGIPETFREDVWNPEDEVKK